MQDSIINDGPDSISNVPVSAKDFVLSTYNPRVAILCSSAVESLVAKNNLKFCQLLMPFTKLSTEVCWQEPVNGQMINPRGIRITPVDIASWKPINLDSQKNKKQLNNVVAQNLPPLLEKDKLKFRVCSLGGGGKTSTANYNVEVPAATPWFDNWRDTFLKLHSESQISQHEFLHHFMACVLVISSAEAKTSDELTNVISKLSKSQQQHQSEWPNTWAFSSVLKFYLIIHEKSFVDQTSADSIYQSLRTTYGGNFCYMLQLQGTTENNEGLCPDIWSRLINDVTVKLDDELEINHIAENDVMVDSNVLHPLSPDLETAPCLSQNGDVQRASEAINSKPIHRGKKLVVEDLKSIQVTVDEFISKALLPYIERQNRLLHESIVNRRGVSKSFFSATKRLFGTGGKAASSIIYSSESLEMMSRKLADVYFLFGHYAGSYQLFHQLKKDFLADSAWVYFASSMEMAAVSHFMMSQVEPPLAMARAFPVHYVNDAINHYIDHCRMIDSATKCALICCECLKQMDNNGEAAAIFIRMTSEECDLRSALMLEQAAYTFLRLNSPRKYALHCVLAGHRYSKAGFRSHSLNCYLQAAQVYVGKGWRFAEDHVNFTIARHQCFLQMRSSEVSMHLQSLLVTPTSQPSQQIQAFYKEYLVTMNKFDPHGTIRREFFIPKVMSPGIRIRVAVSNLLTGEVSSIPVSEEDQQMWDGLEEQVVKHCVNSSVIVFKPSKMFFHAGSDNTLSPQVPCDETFYVEVPLQNPLCIPIVMRDIRLIFDSDDVKSSVINELEMQPEETKVIRFGVCSSSIGTLCFEWISYDLELSSVRVPFKQTILMKGPRLSSNPAERCGRVYAKDLRNQIMIVEKMPLLQAFVENIPSSLYHAQASEFQVVLKDVSIEQNQRDRIENFAIAMDNMKDSLEIHSNSQSNEIFDIISAKKNYSTFRARFDETLSCRLPCSFKAPQSGDHTVLNLLLLYAFKSLNVEKKSKMHRIIKISVKIPLVSCFKLQYTTMKLLNAKTYIGLLRSHNLTPDSSISITNMIFDKNELTIKDYDASTSESENKIDCVQLAPMESRNIILKIESQSENFLNEGEISLNVNWKVTHSGKKEASTVDGCSMVKLDDIKKILMSDENSLIFELHHESRRNNDFNINACLICQIELSVHSRTQGKIILQIEKNINGAFSTGPGVKASGDEVVFIGQTAWVLDVIPMNTYKINYKVAVTRPGTYNVGPILTTNKQDLGNSTIQRKYNLHSPLIVYQSQHS